MKTPSWDEIREFLKLDRWQEDRATGHDFFEKTLPDGELLRTHASRGGSKSISPGRFRAILSRQLRISAPEFWEVLRTGEPAQRPSPQPEPPPPSLPLWLAMALERECGLSGDDIADIDEDRARRLLDDYRSRLRD